MICDHCGRTAAGISYDIELGNVCPVCRSKLNADIRPRRCPFCGCIDVSVVYDPGAPCHFVFCDDCKACGPASDTEADAISDWNTARRARDR